MLMFKTNETKKSEVHLVTSHMSIKLYYAPQ